jgi:hypothetical protein
LLWPVCQGRTDTASSALEEEASWICIAALSCGCFLKKKLCIVSERSFNKGNPSPNREVIKSAEDPQGAEQVSGDPRKRIQEGCSLLLRAKMQVKQHVSGKEHP